VGVDFECGRLGKGVAQLHWAGVPGRLQGQAHSGRTGGMGLGHSMGRSLPGPTPVAADRFALRARGG
jgi:hypothetical protein